VSNNEPAVHSFGSVDRLVGNSLAYLSVHDSSRTLSFGPDVVQDYRGETFEELQIVEGSTVSIDWQPSSGTVTKVSLAPHAQPTGPTFRSGTQPASPIRRGIPPTRSFSEERDVERIQTELHPEKDPKRTTEALRALPAATRKFGKLIDTSNLSPGDLLLSRDLTPDRISSLITTVQVDGGYHANDARWTHAAMYVGDGANVVEATFDSVLGGGSVRLTSLDDYSQGTCSLRFRRSKYVLDDQQRWRICIRAMSRLGRPYDFVQALLMWFGVAFRGQGFFGAEIQRSTSAAVICSTLYADSYNEATRRSLGEVSGVCVPAWLSASEEFNDVQAEWSQISD
jgi:hypothetical protein